ncbi:MAG: radical SAM protein [Candidatus Altiarchaeota archaeon]
MNINNEIILTPPRYYTFERKEWYLLYDPDNVIWIRLNKDGIKIIELIKELKMFNLIIPILVREYPNHSEEEIIEKFKLFIECLISIGFLHLREFKRRTITHFSQEVPSEIYLAMTYKCNLKCKYCYNIKDREKLNRENRHLYLDGDQYKRLIDEAKQLGIKKFILTGGEPLLNSITIEIGNYLQKKGLEAELITNALLINKDNAERIAKNFNIISVSLDSTNKEMHEVMRGKGTFEKVIHTLTLLKTYGAQIRINSVITKANVNNLFNTWKEVLENFGCSYFTPSLYVPHTNNPEIYSKFLPSLNDLIEEQDKIRGYSKNKLGIAVKPANIRFSCGIANGEISIGPEGLVYPCHTLHKPEFVCGNIKRQDLKEILKNSEIIQRLRKFNVNEIEICKECDFKYLCGGGCLAMNYNVNKNLYSPVTFYCNYIKQEQIERMWTSASVSPSEIKDLEGHYFKDTDCTV